MASFGERVRMIREKKGITLKQIEANTNISNGNLSRIERQLLNPSLDVAIKLADYLDESLDYLARGICISKEFHSDPDIQDLFEAYNLLYYENQHALKAYIAFLLSNQEDVLEEVLNNKRKLDQAPKPEIIKEEKKVYLPILGSVAAGMPIMAQELVEGFLPVPASKIKKNTYIVKAKGDSMINAGINNGDLVIIYPQPTVEQGEMALVKVDGDVTIKKFYRYDHEIRLKPANDKLRDIVVTDLAKIRVLGKVIGVVPAEQANMTMRSEFNGDD